MTPRYFVVQSVQTPPMRPVSLEDPLPDQL
jgi:hypothetical protein